MARGGFFSVDSLRNVHVLVVDHERAGRELLRALLTYCGALVTVVGSADEALAMMRHVKPDAVVADVSMPGNDGFALLRAIRALKPEDGGNVPAVVVVEDDGGATAEHASASGFAARLTRPLDPWELCRTIATLVSPA